MPTVHTLTREKVEELAKLRDDAYRRWPDMAPMRAYQNAADDYLNVLVEAARDAYDYANQSRVGERDYVAEWQEPMDATDYAQLRINNDDVPELAKKFAKEFGVPILEAVAYFAHIAEPLPLNRGGVSLKADRSHWLRDHIDPSRPRAGDTWQWEDGTVVVLCNVNALRIHYERSPTTGYSRSTTETGRKSLAPGRNSYTERTPIEPRHLPPLRFGQDERRPDPRRDIDPDRLRQMRPVYLLLALAREGARLRT